MYPTGEQPPSTPSPAASNGRQADGTFGPGNKAGRGNPHAKRAQELRSAFYSAVSEEDLKAVVEAVVKRAKEGDLAAARELFERLLGPPQPADLIDDMAELRDLLEQHLRGQRGAGP